MMLAFFCRTPIHVFRAIQLKIQLYETDTCDIYIFDTFPSSKDIVKRIREKRLFLNVYYINDKDYLKNGKADGLRTFICHSEFKNILKGQNYREIFLFNIYGAFNELIFNVLNNEELIVNMVEDGPTIYHIEKYKQGIIRKYIYPILKIHSYLDNIDYWWFSDPELMTPLDNGKKRKLPHIDKFNKYFVGLINYIFSYDDNDLIKNADIIIMEECYWSDGLLKDGEDLQLYKRLKEKISDKKIVVKLHPRTKINRFIQDFDVVRSNGIPWEVYALNENMSQKILVSLSCTTMISTKLLYDEETYSLLLYPIIEDRIRDKYTGEKYLSEERKAKINSQARLYHNIHKFAKAQDMDQAIEIINRWLLEVKHICG